MNTTLMNQTIWCGQPRKEMEISFMMEEMNEDEKRFSATLIDCKHPDEKVVDRFYKNDKNVVITAMSMNSLKDQIFQILEIPESKFRTTSWMKLMRINGKTIDNIFKHGSAPVLVETPVLALAIPVETHVPVSVGIVYLLKGRDFGYIGQTTRSLRKRMKEHKRACLDNLNGNFKTTNSMQPIYTAINNNGGWAKVEISVLDTFEFKSNKDTLDKENEWIRKIKEERPIYLMNSMNMSERL